LPFELLASSFWLLATASGFLLSASAGGQNLKSF